MRYDAYLWTKASEDRNTLSQRYEPVQPIFLATMASRVQNSTFIDIGANIGSYSVVLGALGATSEVLAFEPNPHCFKELEENIALNKLQGKTSCFDIAVSDRAGEADFGLTSDLGGDGGLVESHHFLQYVKQRKMVKIQTLDSICSFVDRSIIVKIDVEGHEYNVIKGAQRTLSENIGFIQIEILDSSPYKKETIDKIEELGWMHVVRIGNDHFFTNHRSLGGENERLALIEEALERVVHESLHAPSPARRKILPGLTLEISYRNAQKLKSILKHLRIRSLVKP